MARRDSDGHDRLIVGIVVPTLAMILRSEQLVRELHSASYATSRRQMHNASARRARPLGIYRMFGLDESCHSFR